MWQLHTADYVMPAAMKLLRSRQSKASRPPEVYDYLWDAWTRQSDRVHPSVDWDYVLGTLNADSNPGLTLTYADQNRDGMLLLHLVCALEPPLTIVDMVIQENPDAVSARSEKGQLTPLMIACGRNAPLATIRHLCRLYPSGLREFDGNGYAPIHWTCRGNVSYKVLEMLLMIDMEVAFLSVGANATTNHFVGPGKISPLEILYQNRSSVGTSQNWDRNQWRKLAQLLSVHHFSCLTSEHESSFSTLHACLACQCPSYVIDTALGLARDESGGARDARGNLPIHYAVRAHTADGAHLRKVLAMFPGAARLEDSEGQLPLHEALRHSRPWRDGIEDIFVAHPPAANVLDGATRLHPFVLAALHSDLEAVYSLLRHTPHVLREFY